MRWENFNNDLTGQYDNVSARHMEKVQAEEWSEQDFQVWDWSLGRCGTNNDKTKVEIIPLVRENLKGNLEVIMA